MCGPDGRSDDEILKNMSHSGAWDDKISRSTPPQYFQGSTLVPDFTDKKRASTYRLHRATVKTSHWSLFYKQLQATEFGRRIMSKKPDGLGKRAHFPSSSPLVDHPSVKKVVYNTAGKLFAMPVVGKHDPTTPSFSEFVSSFMEKTHCNTNDKKDLVKILINLQASTEDMTSLTSPQHLSHLSSNKTYPQLALYIMMKIDNNQGGIPEKSKHFTNLLSSILYDKLLCIDPDLLGILYNFVARNLDPKILSGCSKAWHTLIASVAIACVYFSDEPSRSNLSLAINSMSIQDMNGHFFKSSFKGLNDHDKLKFLRIFAEAVDLFTTDIVNQETYDQYFTLYEQLLMLFHNTAKLLPTISDQVETISIDALKYRYKLVTLLIHRGFEQQSISHYGRVLIQVLLRDLDFFVKGYSLSKNKEYIVTAMKAVLKKLIKDGGLLSLLEAIRRPELVDFFNFRELPPKIHNVLKRDEMYKVFNEGTQIPILLRLQKVIMEYYQTNLDINADFSLNCRDYPFNFQHVVSSASNILSITSSEMAFIRTTDQILTKDSFSVYYDLCETLVGKYVTSHSPSSLSQEFPDKIPASLLFLMLFTHNLKNLDITKLLLESGRLVQLEGCDDSIHWRAEIKAYKECCSSMESKLLERAKLLQSKWARKSVNEYNVILHNLKTYFNKALKSVDELNVQYDRDILELSSLLKVNDWLDREFGFDIQYLDNESPISQLIEMIKSSIITATGPRGHHIRDTKSLAFLGHFTSEVNHSIFFDIIFKFYTKDITDIDSIVAKTLNFMTLLISQSDDIPLNDIFKQIIDTKGINFRKELQIIHAFIKSNQPYDDMDSALQEFITSAISLFGIQSNIKYLDSFLNEHNYFDIRVHGVEDDQLAIKEKLDKDTKIDMSIGESQKVFDDITLLIGGLKYSQLEFFSCIQLDIIEFFASFADRSGFEKTNSVITQNLISDTCNSTLHNNTIQAYKILEPFIGIYYNAKVRPEGKILTAFESLKDLCIMVDKHLDSYTNLDVAFGTVSSVIKELPQIKVLYATAGGMYNSESILPTVGKLLQGSEFMSRSPSCEEGSLGWKVTIDANSLVFDQAKIQDFVQGLKISNNDRDPEKERTIKTFSDLVQILCEIHSLHNQLDRVHHPKYFNETISRKFSEETIENLKELLDHLENQLLSWNQSIKSLPHRLWLLKAHGLSSLISSYNDLSTAALEKRGLIDPDSLAPLLEPYIKYCFQSSNVTRSVILDVLKSSKTLLSPNMHYSAFLREFMERLEQVEHIINDTHDSTDHRGPMMVRLECKNNIYNVLLQLNNSMLPHPSQLFYEHTFSKDIDYFFDTIENMAGKVFFLIGIPKDKTRLIQWLSKHYSNRSDSLARLYIITTDKSASNDHFSFIPMYTGTFDTVWKNFKDQWKLTNGGRVELSLVSSPDSGTGKSFFIRSQTNATNNSITIHIHPNFDAGRLIGHLRALPPADKLTTVMIHFSVSPYCDFDAFNHFIYPLITYGIVFGQRLKEMIIIEKNIQLQIFVEIGSPMVDRRAVYPKYTDYLDDTVPLIFHLAETKSHTKPWVVTRLEEKCFSEFKCLLPLPSRLNPFNTIKTTAVYFEKIKDFLKTHHHYQASFLSDPKHLLHHRNFLKILHERLVFLDSYRETYSESAELVQKHLLSPDELHEIFLVESIKLTDPAFSTSTELWNNPPILTARFNSESNPKLVEIEYVDFSTSQLLKGRVESLKTMKTAIDSPGEFRSTIAHAFGITSRTGIVIDLCHQFGYVLTPDFAIRLLFLHNKVKNQRSLVLVGDTGVGKTFILLFYSLLINAKNRALPDILYKVKEKFNKLFMDNPSFKLKGIIDNDQEVSLLPGNPSIDMIVSAIGQFADYEPKLETAPSLVQSNFKSTVFSTIELLIRKLIRKYPLIDLPSKSIIRDIKERSNLSTRIIQTKASLLQAVVELCGVQFKSLFHRIIMHQKFTRKEFKLNVLRIIQESKDLVQIDPNLKMVVFIDEFNTCPNDTLSLVNEIFIDGTLDGEACIPDNIFWIGAMNPPHKSIGDAVDYTGQSTATSDLAFVVQHPPPSMEQLTLTYGEFSSENEGPFLVSLFSLKTKICSEPGPSHPSELKEFILVGQNALRDAKQSRTHVSIRDITRIVDLYQFFSSDRVGVQILMCSHPTINKDNVTLHWWSMVAAIALTYYVRLSPGKVRDDLHRKLNQHYVKKANAKALNYQSFSQNFDTLFKKIYTSFCHKRFTTIPAGIALTESLMQNIFCAAIAINVRIPLCVVGPPGCSKTLSFGIVLDNMNANKHQIVNNDIQSPWSLMPNADPFRYQCTPHTTDIEIKDKFEQARTRQAGFDLSGGRSRCVVFFDEAGLVNENDSPMKIMHDYLDKVSQKMDKDPIDISIIILSNKILDAAKTNRMMLLVHPPSISGDDEKALVFGCLYNTTAYNDQITSEQSSTCVALCKSYKQVNKYSKLTKPYLFHQRDFVYFLRHLARGIKSNNNQLTGDVLRNSLERNFGGINQDQFLKLSDEFYTNLEGLQLKPRFRRPEDWMRDNTIVRIKESLEEELGTNESPNICPFRYIMIIDPTENESALMILKELEVEHTVIRVGGFERDNTTESLINVVSQIKNAMAKGGTVVLVNTSEIDGCFYDVFNRYFTLMPSGTEGSMNFIANVSFGAHSVFCTVHPKFKIIVHLPLSSMGQTQLPWLNRFEKYQLSLDKMVTHTIESNNMLQLRHGPTFKRMKESAMHFVSKFHIDVSNKSLLSGFSESETIPSLIYSFAKNLLKNDRATIEPHRVSTVDQQQQQLEKQEDMIYRKLNWKLLQIARPESIFKCHSLPTAYIEEYLLRQEHFNILRFLNCLFVQKLVDKNDAISNRWTIFTRTSLTLHRLKDTERMDQFHRTILAEVLKNKELVNQLTTDNILKIIQLSRFKSSAECHLEIKQFMTSEQLVCMVIADMTVVNQHQLNFIADQFTVSKSNKLLITICHYPPEFSFHNKTKLNSIFLNGMEYIYIDTLGIKIDTQLTECVQSKVDTDIRTWIAVAYGLPVNIDPISLEKTFDLMFFNHLSDIAHTTNNFSMAPNNPLLLAMTPRVRDFYTNAHERRSQILELFQAHPTWHNEIVQIFAATWSQKDLLNKIISNISKMVLAGKHSHSFIDSIKDSMTSFFYPIISQIFKILTNYQAYGGVDAIGEQDEELETMVSLYIKSVKVPSISDKIELRFEPITLVLSPIPRKFSSLPVYDSVASVVGMLFDKILDTHTNRGIVYIFEKFTDLINSHLIATLLEYIESKPRVLRLYQQDFVTRTMKFTDYKWTDFVITMMGNIFPIKSKSILLYNVSKHFFSTTIHLLKNFVSPLLHLCQPDEVFSCLKNALTNEVLRDIAETKAVISSKSIQILYEYIKRTTKDRMSNLVDTAALWCSVVREIFDRIPFSQILLHQISNRNISIYIHTVYTLCMYIATTNEVDAISIACIFESIDDSDYNGVDHIEAIAKQFMKLNGSRKKAGLDTLPVSCYLDNIEPLIHLSDDNTTKFLHLVNRTKKVFDYCNYEFVQEITFGWATQIIISNIGSWPTYRSSANLILKDVDFKKVIIPLIKRSEGMPSENILSFIGVTAEDYDVVPKYPRLAEILYYVCLESLREMDDIVLIDKWNAKKDTSDAFTTIQNRALNTAIIDKLITTINTKTDVPAILDYLQDGHSNFTRVVNRILYVEPNLTYLEQIQRKWYHIYLFNKITLDKTLLQILRSDTLLKLIGLQEHYMSESLVLQDPSLFQFVIDPTTQEGKLYKMIKDSVDGKSLQKIYAIVEPCLTSPRSLGFIRMSLFLICYQYYIEGRKVDFLKKLLAPNSDTTENIGARPYMAFYEKLLYNRFNPQVKFDQILIKADNKSKDHYVLAQLLVNFCAISIGSNTNSYLFNCTVNPKAIAGKYFPASENLFRDCGMVHLNTGQIGCMSGNALHKFIAASASWGAFSWTVSVGNAELVAYLTNPGIHFANFLETKTVDGLTDYVNIRSLNAIAEVKANQDLAQKHIETSHLLSEFIFKVWSESYSSPPKQCMMSTFNSVDQVKAYEEYLKTVIVRVLDDFGNIQRNRNDAILKQSKGLYSISNIRQEYTKTFTSPLYSPEYVQSLILEHQEQFKLLHFFSANINQICLSKYFSDLVRFLQTFFKYFARRLPYEYRCKTVPECIEYLEQNHMESSEVIGSIQKVWIALKESWENIVQQNPIMEGGCQERQDFEKILEKIDDTTLLINIIHVGELSNEGLIIRLVNNWMDNTQSKAIEFRDSIPKTSLFSRVIEGLDDIPGSTDIGDISLDYGDVFMLIGSHFKPEDFGNFVAKCISQYQTSDRQGFKPDLSLIEKKLITNYVSGKISGLQLKQFHVDFPFLCETTKPEEKDHNLLIPESIKELIDIQSSLRDDQFNHQIENDLAIPLTNKCKTWLKGEEFELLARYLIPTITRAINHRGDITHKFICDFGKEIGLQLDLIPAAIQDPLKRISIGSIKVVSKIVVDGYLSFSYLYSNVIDVPADPVADILEFYQKLKADLILETAKSKEAVHKWTDYLQEMIFVLLSNENDPRNKNIDTRLIEFLDRYLPAMVATSPSLKCPSYKDLVKPHFPIGYYSYFMRTLHEILANIKIKDHDDNSKKYRELYDTVDDDGSDPQYQLLSPRPSPSSKVNEDVQDETEDEAMLLDSSERQDEDFGDRDKTDDDDDNVALYDGLLSRPIKECSTSKYAHCLMNWIRLNPNNILNLIKDKKSNPSLYELLKRFSQNCLKNSTSFVDIEKIIREIGGPASVSSGDYLVHMLNKLSILDPRDIIKNLNSRTIRYICSKCSRTLQENQHSSLYTNPTKDFNSNITIESIIDFQHQIENNSRPSLECQSCKLTGVPRSQLIEAPQYLFVCIPRRGEVKKNYSRIAYDQTIDLSKYYISDKKITYKIHSVLCHEDEPGKIDGIYSILIKKRSADGQGVEQIRCSSRISIIEEMDMEHMESNCELLIYEKYMVINNTTPKESTTPTTIPSTATTTTTTTPTTTNLSSSTISMSSFINVSDTNITQDDFFSWILENLPGSSEDSKKLIVRLLEEKMIDSFGIAFECLDEIKEIVSNKEHKFSIALKGSIVKMLGELKERNISSLRPCTFQNALQDKDLFEWMNTIGLKSTAVTTVTDLLKENDIELFSVAMRCS
eukprot:gene10778-12557_t